MKVWGKFSNILCGLSGPSYRPTLHCLQRGFTPIWWCPTWMMIGGSVAVEQRILNTWAAPDLLQTTAHPKVVFRQWKGTLGLVPTCGFQLRKPSASYRAMILPTIRSLKCLSSGHCRCWSFRENAALGARWGGERILQHHMGGSFEQMSTLCDFSSPSVSLAHLFHYNFLIKVVQAPILLMVEGRIFQPWNVCHDS